MKTETLPLAFIVKLVALRLKGHDYQQMIPIPHRHSVSQWSSATFYRCDRCHTYITLEYCDPVIIPPCGA